MPSPIISVEHVGLCRERRTILHDISLEVCRNDFIAITGPNGGGKTSLLRIMLGLLKPTSGRVVYAGLSRPSTGYLPQKNAVDSRFPITVSDVIASGLLALRPVPDAVSRKKAIDGMLQTLQLDHRRDHTIAQISGGQLQRALIGRALICRPDLLVLDEPLSYLDNAFEHRLYDIIGRCHSEGATIILVSHQMSRVGAMASRHIIIDHTLTECPVHHHLFTPPCPCDA